MNKNFYTSTATGEVWTRPDWKPFPKTAPKDHREIMVFGRWKGDEVKDGKIINHFPGGGNPAFTLARWGSYDSNPKDIERTSAWMGNGIGGDIMRHNINWTHWCDLPMEPEA